MMTCQLFSEKYRCYLIIANEMIFKADFLNYLFAETANNTTFAARF